MTSLEAFTSRGISASDASAILNFEQAVCATFADDTNSIRAGEQYMTQVKQKAPDAYLSFLSALLSFSSAQPVREFCAVMLRQSFKMGADIVDRIDDSTIDRILQVVLHLFKTEPEIKLRKQVCYLMGVLGGIVASMSKEPNSSHAHVWDSKFKSIFDALLECSRIQGNDEMRLTVLLGVASVCEMLPSDVIRPYLDFLISVISAGLQETAADKSNIRLTALLATTNVLCNMEDEEKKHMQGCIPLMFNTLTMACSAGDEEVMRDAIEVLMALAKLETKFLKSSLAAIIGCMLQILAKTELEAATRRTAMEFLLSLAEGGQGMIRKIKEFAQNVIPFVLAFVLEIEHDEAEWAKGTTLEEENEEEETGENYKFGLEAIERLAAALGGNVFLPVAQPILQAWTQSKRWEERHAAMMSWARMCNGCEREMKKHLRHILPVILHLGVKDEHIRVRYAASYCVAWMSRAYAPLFQEEFHRPVVETLLQMMTSNDHPRMIGQAALTLVDFVNAENYEHEVIADYAAPMLQAVVQLLNSNNAQVQDNALRCLSAIALAIGQRFREFFPAFLGGVKTVVFNATAEEQKSLRGHAMQALGIMAEAVGRDMFAPEFPGVMDFLVKLYVSKTIAPSDPEHHHLVESFGHYSRCMEANMAPYLPAIVPLLLQAAAVEAFIVLDSSEDSPQRTKEREAQGFQSMTVEMRFLGSKRVTCNASLVEEKAIACNVLYEIALHLKEHFFPYVEETAKILVPSCRCLYNEKVRTASTLCLPELVDSTVRAMQLLPADDPKRNTYVPVLWSFLFPALVDCIKAESTLDGLICVLEAFAECVAHLNIPLNDEQVNELNLAVVKMLDDCQDRFQQRVEASQGEDFDEEAKAAVDEENSQDSEFLGFIYQLIAKVLTKNGASYLPSFHHHLYPKIERYLGMEGTSFHEVSICILSQIIQDVSQPSNECVFKADDNVKTAINNYVQKIFPIAMRHAKSNDVDLRQSCVFALGACAAATGHAFSSALGQTLQTLIEVIEAAGSRDDENDRATDNAISAVGKIQKFCGGMLTGKDLQDPAKLMERWLSYLPCRSDQAEAAVIHDLLCDFIESNHPYIFGAGNANLPAIFAIFGEVLGTETITEKTAKRMIHIMKTIQASMGEALFDQLMQGMENDPRENIHKWLTASMS